MQGPNIYYASTLYVSFKYKCRLYRVFQRTTQIMFLVYIVCLSDLIEILPWIPEIWIMFLLCMCLKDLNQDSTVCFREQDHVSCMRCPLYFNGYFTVCSIDHMFTECFRDLYHIKPCLSEIKSKCTENFRNFGQFSFGISVICIQFMCS